jgi:predicted nuclease of predicted toxin-antitoxin system
MRFLANENIASSVTQGLRNAGHDVLAVKETMVGAKDPAILDRATAGQRVLLTCDKDFGELAFRSHMPAMCGIVLIRITPTSRDKDSKRILAALLGRQDWAGAFWVIEDHQIRRRELPK